MPQSGAAWWRGGVGLFESRDEAVRGKSGAPLGGKQKKAPKEALIVIVLLSKWPIENKTVRLRSEAIVYVVMARCANARAQRPSALDDIAEPFGEQVS